jgi:hypothetical protein
MRLIAFITEGAQIRKILDHIGVDCEPPRIALARGPPLWEDGAVQMGEGGLTAGTVRVFTRVEGSSKGRYLASCG